MSQVITFPGVTHHGEGVSVRMSRSSTLEPLTYITHFEIDQYPHIRRHMKKSTGVGYEPTEMPRCTASSVPDNQY